MLSEVPVSKVVRQAQEREVLGEPRVWRREQERMLAGAEA